MSLSNNQPDPVFPPVPPQLWAPLQAYSGPPPFADLSVLPLEYQPIKLEPTAHFQSTAVGADPLTSQPIIPTATLSDQTLTETPQGADYS